MTTLRPQPFERLLARALEELERERAIFDLPRRSFWDGSTGPDLSVRVHGESASTPLGPAAGPHTQMAQNLVLAWLAGARILELKTVQVLDRLEIPRPCIDAAHLGFNVEWSQELPLEVSAEQYVAAWHLIHVLRARGVNGAPPDRQDTLFDLSVGYDLAGIRSGSVARFLDALVDARARLARQRDRIPRGLRPAAEVEVPGRVASCVTLSTFHGCPAEEIERIVEHLFSRHGFHVVIKLNPTLLGYDAVDGLLHDRLGYAELRLDRGAFERDLQWDHALGLLTRLRDSAARAGRTLGIKFTNTLVVGNHRGRFRDPSMYLSGPPLHVIAMTLAERLTCALGGGLPVSFSGGIEAENFPEAVACGMAPVTTCTDLLRPTGYRRLPRYLRQLSESMAGVGARNLPEYVLARAGRPRSAAGDPAAVGAAAAYNLTVYAARLPDDPRYHSSGNPAPPPRGERHLSLFDCASCNACVVVCPNDAMFSIRTGTQSMDCVDLVVGAGGVEPRPARFTLAEEKQWAVFADYCNACGNCDSFCPESGGPDRAKPRFFGSKESFEAAAPGDGFLLEAEDGAMLARFEGRLHRLASSAHGVTFGDGLVSVELESDHSVRSAVSAGAPAGHVLPLARYHAMRVLRDAVLGRVNAVSVLVPAERRAGPRR